MMALGFLKETHTETTGTLVVYSGTLAFVTCLKNGFADFAQS